MKVFFLQSSVMITIIFSRIENESIPNFRRHDLGNLLTVIKHAIYKIRNPSPIIIKVKLEIFQLNYDL